MMGCLRHPRVSRQRGGLRIGPSSENLAYPSEYLTGFSKRKKQKIEGRRQRAQERDALAHKEAVRKARKELQERAEQNERSVREALGLSAKKGESDCAGAGYAQEDIGPGRGVTRRIRQPGGLTSGSALWTQNCSSLFPKPS